MVTTEQESHGMWLEVTLWSVAEYENVMEYIGLVNPLEAERNLHATRWRPEGAVDGQTCRSERVGRAGR